jgi:hypothetical protein
MSNGPVTSPDSLHYFNPQTCTNDYVKAIQGVLGILQDYDNDQMYPLYGFGGKIPGAPGASPVSHCFALNGDIFYPEANGMQGVLNSYFASLNKI